MLPHAGFLPSSARDEGGFAVAELEEEMVEMAASTVVIAANEMLFASRPSRKFGNDEDRGVVRIDAGIVMRVLLLLRRALEVCSSTLIVSIGCVS